MLLITAANANQKATTDIKKKTKQPKPTLKMVLKPQRNKREREEKRSTKTNPKQLRK